MNIYGKLSVGCHRSKTQNVGRNHPVADYTSATYVDVVTHIIRFRDVPSCASENDDAARNRLAEMTSVDRP